MEIQKGCYGFQQLFILLEMEQRGNVQVLFLGNITHETDQQAQGSDKSSYQDEISFSDPVQIELIRIPNQGKQMYSRLTSQTQKQPIKSLEIYYRNLDKKIARYSPLVCSSSELLVSSSIDILVTLRETIFTDLLVIRGNFTNITFCIYGRVIRLKEQVEKKCPYFFNNIEVQLHEEQPSIKINRNVFNESRIRVQAIEEEYTQTTDEQKVYNWVGYSNDRQLYDSQITNICKLSQQLLVFEDLNHIQQRSIAQIRRKLEFMQSHLSKLFKSAHIGLYYPTPYRATAIPESIPVNIVKIAIKLLSESLSDQYRSLEVLKLILQLEPHAQQFVKLGGVEALIHLFLEFFSPNLVILSSLKLLAVQVFIVLSFWQFSARKMIQKIPLIFEQTPSKSISPVQKIQSEESESLEKPKERSRSRDKKKKRSQEMSKSQQRLSKKNKKDKKSKNKKDRSRSRTRQRNKDKDKDKDKKKQKNKSQDRGKQKKVTQKQKQKLALNAKKQEKTQKQIKNILQEQNIRAQIAECTSFYEIIFKIINFQKNSKIQQLMRILILQITQTLTRNVDVSNQMAIYTPLLRDTKYMLNQGGEMINSKTLKTFASFYPFLNEQQSKDVVSPYICQSQKIKQTKKYNITPKLFKLIDSALSILQSKSQDQAPLMFDQYFMTLISALIENNKNGIAIGLNNFIDAIRVDSLLGLKRQQAVIAILCEYIYEVFIQDEGMNLIFYLDQIHNSMLKIINWLKQDKTFSIQIKRKVQYLINSALIYNHFSGTENNFKSFSEYFIKLIGHQNLDINKILEYSRKQYNKTVNPLTFTNLSENFGLGNFYDVLPAQPLLQIDICLRMFLAILKLNKNIWTVFYQFKFVPAFATLYLKIHSLLKFFLAPTLERQNAAIDIKMLQRLVNNYLQVLKHLTNIFICKLRYESAFNQLTEEQDIFNSIQLYQKWVQTYVFLYSTLHDENSIFSQQKTTFRIKQILANLVQLFDVVLKGHQITKFLDRQRNIKSVIKFIYKQHYETIAYRAGILSMLNVFLSLAQANTSQMISNYLLQKSSGNLRQNNEYLLPDNEKSMFQNILRRNIYRSDANVISNLAACVENLLKQQNVKEKVWEILESILDQNEAHLNQQIEQLEGVSLICQKSTLYANFLSFINAPMNSKVCQHMLRLLKSSINLNSSNDHLSQKRLKLRNSYIRFFKNALSINPEISTQLFQQYLKSISNLLQIQIDSKDFPTRIQILNGVLLILESLIAVCENASFQSIILYGEVIQRPLKPACQINLQKIFNFFRQKQIVQIIDEQEQNISKQIGINLCYLLCRLTTTNGIEFLSTQSRKNSINYLISPQRNFPLSQILVVMDQIAPKKLLQVLRNYIDFPFIQKSQIPPANSPQEQKKQKKSIGGILSKGVFTMISQNDAVGKTRYEFIQDRWQGGDADKGIFQVNCPPNYIQIVQKIIKKNIQVAYVMNYHLFKYQFNGVHSQKIINNLFQFKIRKMFTQEAKKNISTASSSIVMKNIPSQIKKPEVIVKDSINYMNKISNSPANKGISPPIPVQPTPNPSTIPPKPLYQPNLNTGAIRASSSANRQPSPYGNKPTQTTPIKPTYGVPGHGYVNPPLNTYQPMPTNQQPYYPPISKPAYIPQPYNPPNIYEQPPINPPYDSRGYYTNPPYDSRTHMGYQPTYMGTVPPTGGYQRPNIPQPQPMGYQAPYGTTSIYQAHQNIQAKQIQQMAMEAANLLLAIQQNPNAPDREQLKSRANKLLQSPLVHERVTQYFQQMHKKI